MSGVAGNAGNTLCAKSRYLLKAGQTVIQSIPLQLLFQIAMRLLGARSSWFRSACLDDIEGKSALQLHARGAQDRTQ
jgi:hypothetical protein